MPNERACLAERIGGNGMETRGERSKWRKQDRRKTDRVQGATSTLFIRSQLQYPGLHFNRAGPLR